MKKERDDEMDDEYRRRIHMFKTCLAKEPPTDSAGLCNVVHEPISERKKIAPVVLQNFVPIFFKQRLRKLVRQTRRPHEGETLALVKSTATPFPHSR
jgi:hypothetical protein